MSHILFLYLFIPVRRDRLMIVKCVSESSYHSVLFVFWIEQCSLWSKNKRLEVNAPFVRPCLFGFQFWSVSLCQSKVIDSRAYQNASKKSVCTLFIIHYTCSGLHFKQLIKYKR